LKQQADEDESERDDYGDEAQGDEDEDEVETTEHEGGKTKRIENRRMDDTKGDCKCGTTNNASCTCAGKGTNNALEAKPMTRDEWMAAAPPEIQEIVSNANTILQRDKAAIVAKLVANIKDEAKKAERTAVFNAKSLTELETIWDTVESATKAAAVTANEGKPKFVFGPTGKPIVADTVANEAEDGGDSEAMMVNRFDWEAISKENNHNGKTYANN
jgi:hypothetical protein